jgi:hypothetical protein
MQQLEIVILRDIGKYHVYKKFLGFRILIKEGKLICRYRLPHILASEFGTHIVRIMKASDNRSKTVIFYDQILLHH